MPKGQEEEGRGRWGWGAREQRLSKGKQSTVPESVAAPSPAPVAASVEELQLPTAALNERVQEARKAARHGRDLLDGSVATLVSSVARRDPLLPVRRRAEGEFAVEAMSEDAWAV